MMYEVHSFSSFTIHRLADCYNRPGKLAVGLTETGAPCLLSRVMSGI